MSAQNNRSQHYKTIRQTCFTANTAYLILRAFYLVLFLVSKLFVLAYITAGSIVIYLLCYLLMYKKKYYIYALVCGNEFFAYIIKMSLLIGFSTGFHFYLIGLCVVSFFTSYFSKTKNIKGSIIWAGLSLVIYLVLFFVCRHRAPSYEISEWLEDTLFTTHVVVVLLFVCYYLFIFLKYALSLENKIMNESRTDELTQINNRYALYDYFALEENKSDKALALFDIDDFKNINDNSGHVAGDNILKKVAEMLTKELGDCFVCRYGGEEFVIVLDADGSIDRLDAFRKKVEQATFEYEGQSYNITITMGVSKYRKEMPLEKWIEYADEKMYSGKRTGKNKVVA